MITTERQAIEVQFRRVAAGKKGRAKAVRRWFKRTYGRAVEAHSNLDIELRIALSGNFTGCRRFDEVHK